MCEPSAQAEAKNKSFERERTLALVNALAAEGDWETPEEDEPAPQFPVWGAEVELVGALFMERPAGFKRVFIVRTARAIERSDTHCVV